MTSHRSSYKDPLLLLHKRIIVGDYECCLCKDDNHYYSVDDRLVCHVTFFHFRHWVDVQTVFAVVLADSDSTVGETISACVFTYMRKIHGLFEPIIDIVVKVSFPKVDDFAVDNVERQLLTTFISQDTYNAIGL